MLFWLVYTCDRNEEPLRIEHSHWFEYKKGFSHQPMKMLLLSDFPTSVTEKCRPAIKA